MLEVALNTITLTPQFKPPTYKTTSSLQNELNLHRDISHLSK